MSVYGFIITHAGCAEECTSVYNFHVFDESSAPSLLLSYDFNEGGGSAVLDASGEKQLTR